MITYLAYIGPGPGLSMGAALWALILTVFGALFAVLMWPIRRAIAYFKGEQQEGGGADENDESVESEAQDEAGTDKARNDSDSDMNGENKSVSDNFDEDASDTVPKDESAAESDISSAKPSGAE